MFSVVIAAALPNLVLLGFGRLDLAVYTSVHLTTIGLFDFDSIVAQSLRVLRENPKVSKMIAARYPWLIVDEYQDLGPVLHELVLHLHDHEGVRVAAFGDPDQSVMSFTGAEPRISWNWLRIRTSAKSLSISTTAADKP
ncbi:UvrD-helicase domain-containing protein [Sphaerisporangium sp. NPDC049003]|uniref:UvrD-helicase domain-containing protein n=1 Tax=Sphaerisporangium sp. NPDC049003 TaxID=3364517 RepID=UPI00371C0C47